MLKSATNHYPGGFSQGPTNFDFDKGDIILRDGTEIDITSIISQIKIIESIQRVATLVNVSIVDTHDFIDLLKLDGTEKIKFIISRKEPNGELKKFEREVIIAEIAGYKKINPGTLTYTLSCIPEYAFLNQYKTISKHVSGSFQNSIKNICTGDLSINNSDLEISESGTAFKCIIPRMKPVFAINWLLRNADDGGTPYYFYQKANGKICCRSKKEMISDGIYNTYDNKPFFDNEKPVYEDDDTGKIAYFQELQKKITRDRSEIKMSKFYSGAEGSYGATVHHIDIAEKKYNKTKYEFVNKNLLNENSPLANDSQIANTKIETLTEGRNYFINKNTLAFDDSKNYHENITSKSLAEMMSHKALNDTTAQRFEIPGDFDLHAGAIINLELLRVAEIEDTLNNLSEVLSGKHLVTTVEHLFQPSGYTMVVSAKKDSFITSLDTRRVRNEER